MSEAQHPVARGQIEQLPPEALYSFGNQQGIVGQAPVPQRDARSLRSVA